MLNKIISKQYTITMPNIDVTTIQNFNFNSKVGNALFNFQFTWDHINNIWQGWTTMPDLSIREFGVIPNVLNWSRFNDFSLSLGFNGDSIGLTDLINIIINIILWKQ